MTQALPKSRRDDTNRISKTFQSTPSGANNVTRPFFDEAQDKIDGDFMS